MRPVGKERGKEKALRVTQSEQKGANETAETLGNTCGGGDPKRRYESQESSRGWTMKERERERETERG